MENKIYFDNAATTSVRPEVFLEMKPYFEQLYGNASSIYEMARINKKAIEAAREKVANVLNAKTNEIYFTGSGSEADNWAIKGVAEALKDKGNHIITSQIEHHAVLHTCKYLEENGFEVTYLPVNKFGLVNPDDVKNAIKPSTILISIMFANNEIGTIQPIAEIGNIAQENKIYFHTDAVQAVGHVEIDVSKLNVDLLSISGHKLGAAKGVGALFIKQGVKIKPLIHGGGQERNRRAGTENVPGIVGLACAIEMAHEEMETVIPKITELRNKLINGILENIPHTKLNGHYKKRLPGNCNISFDFIEGEGILLFLDMQGISASSGSACTSGSLDPSHVLLAIGLPHEEAHGSLRLTLGHQNTEEEVDKIIEILPPIINRLRNLSPLYEDYIRSQNSSCDCSSCSGCGQ